MYEGPIQDLIDEFGRLPGIGPKSAQRIAFHLLKLPTADAMRLSRAIAEAKERVAFWGEMFRNRALDPARALFIDDNLDVLRAARDFGIGHLRTVLQPDSGRPGQAGGEFPAIRSFSEIMP